MTETAPTLDLTVALFAPAGLDPEQLAGRAAALRRELLDAPFVDAVAPVSDGAAPGGTKGLDVLTIGALALVVAPTVLPAVGEFLAAWMQRNPGVTVKVKGPKGSIEVSGLDLGSRAAVEAFIARLRAQVDPPRRR